MNTVKRAKELLGAWGLNLGESVEGIDVQIGDLNEHQPPGWPSNHGLGATWHNPDGREHLIGISDICPEEKFEEVVLHEFLHVLCERNADDLEEYMVNICAQALVSLSRAQAEIDELNADRVVQ